MSEPERWILVCVTALWAVGVVTIAFWRRRAALVLERAGSATAALVRRGEHSEREAEAARCWPVEPSDLFVAALVVGWYLLQVLALTAAPVSLATPDPKPVDGDGYARQLLVGSSLQLPIVLVVLVRIFAVAGRSGSRWLGLTRSWRQVLPGLLLVPLAIVLVYGVMAASLYLQQRLGIAPRLQEQLDVLQRDRTPLLVAALWISAVGIAPFVEELLFRGFLYPVLRQRLGLLPALLGIGLLFGLAHGNVTSLLPLAAFGLILALMMEFSRSLWVPWLAHAVFNSLTLYFTLRS